MGWSIPIVSIAGTMVRLHVTFLILIVWLGALHFMQGGMAEAVSGVGFVLAVFACVLLHEFGHILTARQFGVETPDVTLLPIGGVASLDRIPEKPSQEFQVAIAGPLVNVAIAAVLIVAIGGWPNLASVDQMGDPQVPFLAKLAMVNLFLAGFNLIPAFPMDGGRILRAALASQMGFARATRVAAKFGQGLAFVFGLAGLFGNPFLLFIAIFVYLAASGESYAVEIQTMARGHLVGDGMITVFETLSADARVQDAADLMIHTTQSEFPVVDGLGRPIHLISRKGIAAAAKAGRLDAPVQTAADGAFPLVAAGAPLQEAIEKVMKSGAAAVGITDEAGRLVGLLNMENITELMLLSGEG